MKILAYTIITMFAELITFIGAFIWNYSLMWLFLPVGFLNGFFIGAIFYELFCNRNK